MAPPTAAIVVVAVVQTEPLAIPAPHDALAKRDGPGNRVERGCVVEARGAEHFGVAHALGDVPADAAPGGGAVLVDVGGRVELVVGGHGPDPLCR